MPARLARATSSASALLSVIHTVVPSTGSSAASDSPITPDPVPRSTTVREVAERAGLVDGDTGDEFGLGTRDQDPPVDGHLDVPERPLAEHVLERFAGRRAGPAIESRWAIIRSVAGSSSIVMNSAPSAAEAATSHSHRAADRSPTLAVVSARSSRHVTIVVSRRAPSAPRRAGGPVPRPRARRSPLADRRRGSPRGGTP